MFEDIKSGNSLTLPRLAASHEEMTRMDQPSGVLLQFGQAMQNPDIQDRLTSAFVRPYVAVSPTGGLEDPTLTINIAKAA